MCQDLIWRPLCHPSIQDGYVISQYGDIKQSSLTDDKSYKASYHSSNGYDYAIFMNKDMKPQLFPIDEILAIVYIPIPIELKNKPVTVHHINGNNRDNDLGNLEWIEDIEEWRDITYPGVKPGMYEVSSWGKVRNKDTGHLLGFNRKGYISCQLIKLDNVKQVYFEHRLVAYEFCVKDIDFASSNINHIDGVKSHNRYKNLEVVTPMENNHHANLTGLNIGLQGGEAHPRATISESNVRDICRLIVKHKGRMKNIMHDIDILGLDASISIARAIKDKHAWKDISNDYFMKDEYRQLLSKSDVLKIVQCILNHKHEKNIAKTVVEELTNDLPNLTVHNVNHIIYKNSWGHLTDEFFKKGDILDANHIN